jgi:hypothetical protein
MIPTVGLDVIFAASKSVPVIKFLHLACGNQNFLRCSLAQSEAGWPSIANAPEGVSEGNRSFRDTIVELLPALFFLQQNPFLHHDVQPDCHRFRLSNKKAHFTLLILIHQ